MMTVRSTLATNFGSACFHQKISYRFPDYINSIGSVRSPCCSGQSTGRAAHLKFSPSQNKKAGFSLSNKKKALSKEKQKKQDPYTEITVTIIPL
jgi:hypothetical protein